MTHLRIALRHSFVLCQIVLGATSFWGNDALAQDTTSSNDSIRRVTFVSTGTTPIPLAINGRRVDGALSGGVGIYSRSTEFPVQGTLNADFSASSETINLIGGLHLGFSDPSTLGLSVGLRFPLLGSVLLEHGLFADASLLFFDNGEDSGAFQTGLRGAITARLDPFEARLAAEMRKSPFGGDKFETWAGIEVGFFFRLAKQGRQVPTRRDTLRSALKYIATTQELEDLGATYNKDELNTWLDRFWQARNVSESVTNDARQEYMRRIDLANERYGTPMTMGVSTDIGRVLLVYGEPNHSETVTSTSDASRHYLLWVDENRVPGRRTAVFLFLAKEGKSSKSIFAGQRDYREVYSDVPGEPSDGIPNDLPPAMISYLRGFGM